MPTITHRLMVSPELFDIATRAIRAYSLANGRFGSVNSVAEWAAYQAQEQPLVLKQLHEMLGCADIAGSIGVTLKVDESWSAPFQQAKCNLESQMGRSITARHVLCALLSLALQSLEKTR